ncbi:Response regulator transcription factor [Sulfidibacter corallicola]|uniref:Response regulator transcription factor n=1 Tax=Sulfidibacter corallicola TaxID=2818388 RepID=A0A8A4TS81_SULCO|nr:LytTR family DNA-binding domain-containing protein [Sulfidibacter corallicola]QTD49405.1 response regulator transcription factor [Sulfidibacter corallicola]
MHILVVEDEPVIRERNARLCKDILGDDLTRMHTAESLPEAQQWLERHPPDLLLLDLDLAGKDGFALLKQAVAGAFHTIIISANTQFALQAFEFGVLDFIAKPFGKKRLEAALSRVSDRRRSVCSHTKYLAVKQGSRLALVSLDTIRYIQGAGPYSELYSSDAAPMLHDKSLERLEKVLPPNFERIHKSYIVNMNVVESLISGRGSRYAAVLRNGERLPIGRTRYKQLKQRFDG